MPQGMEVNPESFVGNSFIEHELNDLRKDVRNRIHDFTISGREDQVRVWTIVFVKAAGEHFNAVAEQVCLSVELAFVGIAKPEAAFGGVGKGCFDSLQHMMSNNKLPL